MSRPVVSHCPLCGAHHAVCGPGGTTAPLDVYNAPRREPDMSELRLYQVTDDHGNTTTMQLNDSDAKRLGATLVAATPATQATVQHAARPTTTVPNRARRTE